MNNLIEEIDRYLARLFRINRSITGPGNRKTLKTLQEIIPLEIKEYQSGESVYDWTIPEEWSVRDAWIATKSGEKIVNFQVNNIHLVGYSIPIDRKLMFEDLRPHLHTHETLADAIPYRTSYYKKNWGFCVTKEQYQMLSQSEGELHVFIDSQFKQKGSLSIGELLISGRSKREVLVSTYICHPSLANDNLSGLLLSAFLAKKVSIMDNQYSYRFVWVPETIGAIAYCAKNEERMKKIKTGLVVTTVGGPGKFGYKQSLDSSHRINRMVEEVFDESGVEYITYPFDINGSDERQYSSQGFGINVVTITKDKYYEYPFYHSSKDNLSYVKAEYIKRTLDLYFQLVLKLDKEAYYEKIQPYCETMLSKYGLYSSIGGGALPDGNKLSELDVIKWILLLSDGEKSINYISDRLGVNPGALATLSEKLTDIGVLRKI